MKNSIFSAFLLVFVLGLFGCQAQQKETLVLMHTNKGDIKLKLYDDTPLHRDNFVKLVTNNFYDSLTFHRVINSFMIQGGDPNSKNAEPGTRLGGGGPGYTIPPEFSEAHYHKRGALAAARAGDRVNPKKESSGSQFYIVQGKKATDEELNGVEGQINAKRNSAGIRAYLQEEAHKPLMEEVMALQQARNGKSLDSLANVIIDSLRVKGQLAPQFKLSSQQRSDYLTVGGTPFLDSEYTVFGEVVEGMDIVDAIGNVAVDSNDNPVEPVIILNIEIIK